MSKMTLMKMFSIASKLVPMSSTFWQLTPRLSSTARRKDSTFAQGKRRVDFLEKVTGNLVKMAKLIAVNPSVRS